MRDIAQAWIADSRSECEAAAWHGLLANLEGSIAEARETLDMVERVYAEVSRHFGTDPREQEA